MKRINIQSIFFSISGEFGYFLQGAPVVFIRFAGCNLNCKDCDTAHSIRSTGVSMSIEDILAEVGKYGVKRVLITGGEPMFQSEGLDLLIGELFLAGYSVAVETNGSRNPLMIKNQPDGWVMDIKLPGSRMNNFMIHPSDINKCIEEGLLIFIKFPIYSLDDFLIAKNLIESHFKDNAKIALSPIAPKMTADQLWDLMLKSGLTNCVLNTQIHKYIWPGSKIER